MMLASGSRTDTGTGTGARLRNAGPELLRIVALLEAVGLHYLSHAGLVPQAGVPLSQGQVVGAVLESLCIACLNVWVLLSGYYMSERSFRVGRLVELLLEVYFYLLLGYLLLLITGVINVRDLGGAYGILQRLFPISGSAYWYMSAYIIVYILSPVLCAGMDALDRGQARAILGGLILFSIIIKTVIPVRFPTDHGGYEAGWFIVLFLMARYIRRFELRLPHPGIIYVLCLAGIAAGTLGFHAIGIRTGHFLDYMNVFYEHNFILNILASVAIFQVFMELRIPEGRIARLIRAVSPHVLGMYLLHEHPEIRHRWLSALTELIGEVPVDRPLLILPHMLMCMVIVAAAGLVVDILRERLFTAVKRSRHAGGGDV